MEIGPPVLEKYIINRRPVPNIDRFDVKPWRSEIRQKSTVDAKFFQACRASRNWTDVQDAEDRMEIGPPVLEKYIINRRPVPNIDRFDVKHSINQSI